MCLYIVMYNVMCNVYSSRRTFVSRVIYLHILWRTVSWDSHIILGVCTLQANIPLPNHYPLPTTTNYRPLHTNTDQYPLIPTTRPLPTTEHYQLPTTTHYYWPLPTTRPLPTTDHYPLRATINYGPLQTTTDHYPLLPTTQPLPTSDHYWPFLAMHWVMSEGFKISIS